MAFKRNVLDLALPFPENYRLSTHDNWIFLIAIFNFKVKILNKPLIFYRRHTQNISNGGFISNTNLYFKIKYRLYLVFHLIFRSYFRFIFLISI